MFFLPCHRKTIPRLEKSKLPKQKPKLYRVLLLEDDLEVAGHLLLALNRIEPHLAPYDLDVTHFSTSDPVCEWVNRQPKNFYDIALMDRDCKLNRSFHVLDLSRIRAECVISISSTPMWNQAAEASGIKHVVPKSFNDLDGFAERAAHKVYGLLKGNAQPGQLP